METPSKQKRPTFTCYFCGYSMSGLSSTICPECGRDDGSAPKLSPKWRDGWLKRAGVLYLAFHVGIAATMLLHVGLLVGRYYSVWFLPLSALGAFALICVGLAVVRRGTVFHARERSIQFLLALAGWMTLFFVASLGIGWYLST